MTKDELNVLADYPDLLTMSEIIGADNVLKLTQTFSGERIFFPRGVYKNLRNQNIMYDYQRLLRRQKNKKESLRFLAVKYGIGSRNIQRIIQRLNAEAAGGDPQGSD